MGNSIGASGPVTMRCSRPAAIAHYFTAKSWIEGLALEQLAELTRLPGMLSVAGFPDLHPGKYGPVGMAALSSRLYPQLIGNDIGCGMAFFELDMPQRKFRIDKAATALRELENIGFDAPDIAKFAPLADLEADVESLGTIGGGNHFCEIQSVEELLQPDAAELLDRQKLYLLVHTGSRNLGASVFDRTIDENGAMTDGLDPASEAGMTWLTRHDLCVEWAVLNRQMIAQRVAEVLRTDVRLIADVPHNLVRRHTDGYVHYKGAAAVQSGGVAPIAGSRASLSYIVQVLSAAAKSHWAISHGAGRKYDRRNMHGRIGVTRSEREALLRNQWGGIAICDDRKLAVEEAASAYKNAGQVLEDLAGHGLVRPLASMKPLITYKKTSVDHDELKRDRVRDRRMSGRRKNG
ncbi:RNA ligase RtcB family protein [Rhizobium sp. P44RR-XXIV]|uniref:RNA ligase RtcB family protein n=1 Tax=Rhizobium sp. P44RR-XXIV TaxID=1921145 RepID=UPI000985A0C0|nr:RNA ligase RtcB family protein [Rhizobium sp. P44RR-XXIV]TIX88516.1 RNA ligase RtcB family protein [Rhizobium sp. P44RR-XXIV]